MIESHVMKVMQIIQVMQVIQMRHGMKAMLEMQGSQVIQVSLAHLAKCAFNKVSLPKIACKIVRPFKPDFRERWQVSEFSVSSRKTRSDQGNSRSRLDT